MLGAIQLGLLVGALWAFFGPPPAAWAWLGFPVAGPAQAVFTAACVGAALGAASGVLHVRRQTSPVRQHRDFARRTNLRFHEDDLPLDIRTAYPELSLFQRGSSRYITFRNTGEHGGRPVDLFDYCYTETTQSSDGTQPLSHHQTVLVLGDAGATLPQFRLEPRTIANRMTVNWFGTPTVSFNAESAPGFQSSIVDAFNEKYFVFASEDGDQLARGAFRLPVMEFLIENPGWSMESSGGRLAIFQAGRLFEPEMRVQLLEFANRVVKLLNQQSGGGARVSPGPQGNSLS